MNAWTNSSQWQPRVQWTVRESTREYQHSLKPEPRVLRSEHRGWNSQQVYTSACRSTVFIQQTSHNTLFVACIIIIPVTFDLRRIL